MNIMNTIRAIVMLGMDGKQALSKYYDDKIQAKPFERKIFEKTKTQRARDEVLMLDGYIIIHRCVADLHLYIVGGRNENPLVLDRMLNCLAEVVTTLLNRNLETTRFEENLDTIILALDEICDNGLILEIDPNIVLDRVCLKEGVAEQSMAQVLQSATEQFKFPWIRS